MLFMAEYTIENASSLSKKELRDEEHECGIRLLYELLSKHFGIESPIIKKSENGKPYIDNEGVFFNISHSHGTVICVVSDAEIGVDIECINDRTEDEFSKVANRFFTSPEIDFIRESESLSEAFCRVWTRKEAYAKLKDLPLSRVFSHDTMGDSTKTYVKDGYVISIAQ